MSAFLNGVLSGILNPQVEDPVRPSDPKADNESEQKVNAVGPNAISSTNRVPVGGREQLVICRMGAGDNDGNDYDKDRGATDSSGCSQDPRWAEAAQLRAIGKAFENGAADHMEEALTSVPAAGANGILGKPFTMLEQAREAVSDKWTAQDYFTRANQLENQIAQDACRDRENGDSGGCLIL